MASCTTATEKPDFKLLIKEGRYELRAYNDLPVVSTPMASMEKRNDSFRSLFRYISGDNNKQKKISMTSPVFMNEDSGAKKGQGSMSFLLPKKVAKNGSPQPTAKQVQLGTIKGGKFAVIRFKGWRDKAKQDTAEKELIKWVNSKGWKMIGNPFFAFYNPPWTPEIFRRNEVWIQINQARKE